MPNENFEWMFFVVSVEQNVLMIFCLHKNKTLKLEYVDLALY
jgi:hypothetical protein